MAESKSTQANSMAEDSRPPRDMLTTQQLIALTIDKGYRDLLTLSKERVEDDNWDEKDVDVDMAIDLLLLRVSQLKEAPKLSQQEFESAWFEVGAVLNLAASSFSRPDSCYFRTLDALRKSVYVMIELVDDHQAGLEVAA